MLVKKLWCHFDQRSRYVSLPFRPSTLNSRDSIEFCDNCDSVCHNNFNVNCSIKIIGVSISVAIWLWLLGLLWAKLVSVTISTSNWPLYWLAQFILLMAFSDPPSSFQEFVAGYCHQTLIVPGYLILSLEQVDQTVE